MIIDIQKSPKKNKRFRVTMDNGKKYDFGYISGSTYIDNLSREKRSAYLKRHMANKIEYKLITELVLHYLPHIYYGDHMKPLMIILQILTIYGRINMVKFSNDIINMDQKHRGRPRINTDEQRKQKRREISKRFYARHSKDIINRVLTRYYALKQLQHDQHNN